MVQLTRISGTGNRPVVVSSQDDAMVELGLVELPPESAMVCQPRALAGVVKEVEHDVKISRHWRLASLHGWLTLQLRFLVFHGPCIFDSARLPGSGIEPSSSGRLIDQAATLGFSANLDYSNSRCETLVPICLASRISSTIASEGAPASTSTKRCLHPVGDQVVSGESWRGWWTDS